MENTLRCTCIKTNGTLTFVLSGEWRFGDKHIQELDNAIEHARGLAWSQLIVDITRMTAQNDVIGTDFIAEMVRVFKLAEERNAFWGIIATSAHLKKVFDLCRLGSIFEPHIFTTTTLT